MFKLFNLFTWVHDLVGYFTFNLGGDPPAPAPTQSTSYTTNIPEYAKPYVENMLNAAQAQIYNPSMTGFNQYVPYSTNPADYVAGASPMQKQAYSTAANMQVPGQYGLASLGTLGTAGNMRLLGQQMGGAGMNYAMQATNPYATQAYMNPYLQASLAPQLALANQQYDIAGQQQQSKAAQSGAFGGTREALMSGLNRQNQMLAQNQLIGQGYNRAFDAAQQAQQFGANLGLQGQQAQAQALASQLGAYNQLAGLGGQELAAQQGIANLQNQYGQQQQQQQQNIINQAVQNYATAQQYPFMQLGLLNSMLRGLPMQQSSTQMYQAPPNALSTIAGLGATAYGLSQPKKSGGVIKAAGGIPMSRFSDEQLNKVKTSPFSTPLSKVVADGNLGVHRYINANPEAKRLISQQPMPMPQPQQVAMMPQNRVGLDAIGTGEMSQMAGGGIIAFADEGAVPPAQTSTGEDWFKINPKTKEKEFDANKFLMAQASHKLPTGSEIIKEDIKEQKQALADAEKTRERNKWLNVGSTLLQSKSPFWQVGAGEALGAYTKSEEDAIKDLATRRKDITGLELTAAEKDQAAQDRIIGIGMQAWSNQEASKLRALTAQNYHNQLQTTKDQNDALKIQDQFDKMFKANLDAAVKDNANLLKTNPASMDQLRYEAYNSAYQLVAKSPLGQKHMGGIATPDNFKLTLPSYVPGKVDETVKAPPAADTESHWYDPSTWGRKPTGQVDKTNKFLN